MNALQSFTFDGITLRVFGDAINPVFIAADICKAIGIKNPSDAIKSLAPFERSKVVVDGHELNAVNESGLYTLILRSREAVKEGTPAYRFRLKVTAEILPAIRKQGKYECPAKDQLPPPMLTEQQAYAIMSEVAKRAKNCGAHYQTIYRALKARYQVTKYTHIPREMYEDAVRFIQTMSLSVPEATPQKPAAPKGKHFAVTQTFLERQRDFVYCWRYLYRDELERLIKLMTIMESPHAGMLWDVVHDMNLVQIEESLAQLGFPVTDLNCYKHWASHQPA